MMQMSYHTIRRYASGEPYKLCRINKAKMKRLNNESYREDIVSYLQKNMTFREICARITVAGYNGKQSQCNSYCHELIDELSLSYNPRRNSAWVAMNPTAPKPKFHSVSFSDVFDYIWSDKELDVSDVVYIINKYPYVFDIIDCVRDFRNIFIQKNPVLLKQFIFIYSVCDIKPLKSFASGLLMDFDAVCNAVSSDLSNGFVEGINNKIKVIKRTMYGRAKIDLLRIKVLHCL